MVDFSNISMPSILSNSKRREALKHDSLFRDFTAIWREFNKVSWGDSPVEVLRASDRIIKDIEKIDKLEDFIKGILAFSKTLELRSSIYLQVLLLDEVLLSDISLPADQRLGKDSTAKRREAALAAQVEMLIKLPRGHENKNLYESLRLLAAAAEGARTYILSTYRDKLSRAIITNEDNLLSFIKSMAQHRGLRPSISEVEKLFNGHADDFKRAYENNKIDWRKEHFYVQWVP